MNKLIFPSNPENGMIFEATVGLFFEYDASDNSWIRIDGINALGLATPIQNGLMDNEDLIKLDGLIIPPLQASLKGEDCGIIFDTGRIRLTSTDKSLDIRHTRDVVVRENGETTIEELPWQIHENTGGYDFKLNIDAFVKELEDLNRLTKIQIQGVEGADGEAGNNGQDNLDTGPVGETGTDGKNSTFGGSLQPETISVEIPDELKNRAIVDATIEQSDNGNFLVLTRANISDPESCLEIVKGKSFNSPWIVAIDESEPKITRRLVKLGDCTTPCLICNTSLYHLYVQPMITAIDNRFIELTIKLKDEKERLFRAWMDILIQLFNEQKASLCCALENCTTKKRNTTDRRYIEAQRIQAAISKHSLIIDGDEDKIVIDTNAGKDCNAATPPLNNCIENVCDWPCDFADGKIPFNSAGWEYNINGGPFTIGQAPFGNEIGVGHPSLGSFDFRPREGDSTIVSSIAKSLFPLDSTIIVQRNLGKDVNIFSIRWFADDVVSVYVNDHLLFTDFHAGRTVLGTSGAFIVPVPGVNGNVQAPTGISPAGLSADGDAASNELGIAPALNIGNGLDNIVKFVVRDSTSGLGGLTTRSYFDAEILFTRVVSCSIPSDFPQNITSKCAIGVDIIAGQYTRMLKTIGDPNSFEMASPGPGLTITSHLSKVYVSVLSPKDGNSFKVGLVDSDFNTYIWPLRAPTIIGAVEFVEFNIADMVAIDSHGGSTLRVPTASRPIIAVLLEVSTTADSNKIEFGDIALVETNGNAYNIAGFEWAGDTNALRRDWVVDCASAESVTLGGYCNTCFVKATVDPRANLNSDSAFELNLPRGEYKAIISDCCAELASNVFSGRVAVEYQAIVTADATTTIPTQDSFANLGNFTNLQQARSVYIGQTLPFSHAGGIVKFWTNDTNIATSDNSGFIEICIRPQICDQPEPTATSTAGAIFVYADSINPNNLIGFINPFSGTMIAVDNYNYGGGSHTLGPNILEGPTPEVNTTQVWFYNGTDGLSAIITNGITGTTNNVNIGFKTTGNSSAQDILVSDDSGELSTIISSTTESSFLGNWTNSTDVDGGVIGYFDNTDDSGWVLEVTPTDLGTINRFIALSSTGEDVELSFATDGIGAILATNKIIFTRLVNGCQMFYKQVEWLERGHRIGAACSCVVTIGSTKYIVVKRSIGTDTSCGGGETLANQCISTFITSGDGHPAIAWPTFNNQEFIGMPTSGFQGFIQDPALSDQILAKIQAGDIEEPINGDPAGQIPFVLFASSF